MAEGFARALSLHESFGQTYEVAGPTALPFDELLDQIGRALGKPRVRKVHAPMGLVKLSTRLLHWLPMYPVTMDQLRMLEEESVADPSRFYADMSLRPEPLADGLKRLLSPPR